MYIYIGMNYSNRDESEIVGFWQELVGSEEFDLAI